LAITETELKLIAALASMGRLLREAWDGQPVAAITLPGDRRDDLVEESAATVATWFSRVVVYEDHDLRGREAGGEAADAGDHPLAGGVGVQVGVFAFAECFVNAEDLKQVEYLVADIALVVAHWFLLDENATYRLGTRLSYPPVTRSSYTHQKPSATDCELNFIG